MKIEKIGRTIIKQINCVPGKLEVTTGFEIIDINQQKKGRRDQTKRKYTEITT